MNVEERRHLFPGLLGRSLQFYGPVTNLFRYDAMPSQRPLVYSAVPANEQTRCVISEGRHKSGVQAKGELSTRKPRPTRTYSFSYRYIKELAERVNRLENSGVIPPDVQYAPVNHDASGPGGVYSPALDYTRQRNHGMIVGPHTFEPGHQELQDFPSGHGSANTDAATQGFPVPRALHATSIIHHQSGDTLDNIAPDPSVGK